MWNYYYDRYVKSIKLINIKQRNTRNVRDNKYERQRRGAAQGKATIKCRGVHGSDFAD